jgi:asparagine synthase (glutamine-hydrolysing)
VGIGTFVCGLAGYFLSKNQEVSSAAMMNMLELQKHRGPDDQGIIGIDFNTSEYEEVGLEKSSQFTINPNLILGFNRLSILDLTSAGHQPMISDDGKVILMLNGEVYNAFDFKGELELKGYKLKGRSDTEIVLYLFIEYGLIEMLNKLNGMFSIVIYDGREKRLHLIRDRFGIKPLYISEEQNRFAFSSELKSFKAMSSFRFELEKSKLSEFLVYRNLINDTLFLNVRQIEPGTFLTLFADGKKETTKYFDFSMNPESLNSPSIEETREKLKTAVKRQLVSDVALGFQLSGGIDSSLVTAYAIEFQNKTEVETFSVVFQNKTFDESEFIDIVVNKLGVKSQKFILDSELFFNSMEEAVWHFEQPLNHPNSIGIFLLCKSAKGKIKVIMTGEGADEILEGYSRFLPNRKIFRLGSSIKRILRNPSSVFSELNTLVRDEYILASSFGGVESIKEIYEEFSLDKAISARKRIWESISISNKFRKRHFEILTYLPDILVRQDKLAMASSIESRVPFLDNEFVDLALRIRNKDLIRRRGYKWHGKFFMKELCADIFGSKFSFRNKMGFAIPLKEFFKSEGFRIRWHKEFLPSIEKRGLFQTQRLSYWIENLEKTNSKQQDLIWLAVGFEIWAKQYLD